MTKSLNNFCFKTTAYYLNSSKHKNSKFKKLKNRLKRPNIEMNFDFVIEKNFENFVVFIIVAFDGSSVDTIWHRLEAPQVAVFGLKFQRRIMNLNFLQKKFVKL